MVAWDSTCPVLNPVKQWHMCPLCGREFRKRYQLQIHELAAAGSVACK